MKQMRDSFHMLDETLIFSNSKVTKTDYASKSLKYPLEEGDTSAYDRLMEVLYSPEERNKIEWVIGSIVTGDSKTLQKFLVLYGAAGTGKSTVINIIQQLFDGYYSVFDAKALGSSSNAFALEAFRSNPLVAIQHDGDLSRIEDNTKLNSLVSHEMMTVNEKFHSAYSNRFKCFLIMGTNKPVKISDAKSGLIRRLIDATPTGNKVSMKEYRQLTTQIGFELGAIAWHCQEVYLADPGKYDNYVPITMMGASNDFYNFVYDSYYIFKRDNGVTLKSAWEMYKSYCDDAKVSYPYSQRVFQEELKNYFLEYKDRAVIDGDVRVRKYYQGFKTDKFELPEEPKEAESDRYVIIFEEQKSILDEMCADCPAQYATKDEIPIQQWDNVRTKLSDLDSSKLHYVRVPENHIVIDFDLTENGEKSFEKNLEAASKWPATYAELSKSGCGIHLHYIYKGDVTQLQRQYSDKIEVKVFSGKTSLRRKLTKCNNLPINTISSGLPLKEGDKKVVSERVVKSEKKLRELIIKALNREIWPNTKPNIDYIYKILDDAQKSGLQYDVSDLYDAVFDFALSSTNQKDKCLSIFSKMKFCSEEDFEEKEAEFEDDRLYFYDVEVFPNLFLVNYKVQGEGTPVIRLINPTPEQLEPLMSKKLVGFNCRRYDNHIMYGRWARHMSNEELYELSQAIIQNKPNCYFREAYNLSFTDVYDFCSKKQSLKKWEIELGIHHQELGLPWDKPVPEDKWQKVAEYCDNDVLATEAVFNARQGDFLAREILADVADASVNTTTNTLTTKIIFGEEKHPILVYTDLATGERVGRPNEYDIASFPGYTFENGKNLYRGVDVGKGGNVYSEPGMYSNVALLDIASMHPTSMIALNYLGSYTSRFKDILDARLCIKHGDFEKAKTLLDGKLAPYLDDESKAESLAYALKIAINSVYGLTAASFDNPFRDPRNVNNIVALRGALFMEDLKHAVQEKGFIVAHIKTDSIKIPDATPEIIQFVMDFGKKYGYTFEHEATYEKMCLVNDAVYIAKYSSDESINGKHAGEWTATGAQFQVPYVFKSLFSKEEIIFEDMCETKSVSSAIYIDRSPDEALRYLNNPHIIEDHGNDFVLDDGHSLHFVGKVGLFTPVKKNVGGGTLVREGKDKDGHVKYDAVTGTKGYLWMESEVLKTIGNEDYIDRSYYDNQVTSAVHDISAYGDFEWFVADDDEPSPWMNEPMTDDYIQKGAA